MNPWTRLIAPASVTVQTIRWRLNPFPGRNTLSFFLCFLLNSNCFGQQAPPALTEFESDRQAVEETLLGGALTGGFILASSALYTHRFHPEFLELTQSIRRGYACFAPEEAKSLLDFRVNYVTANPNGLAWMDVGLLAQANGENEIARQSFQNALQDQECCRIPSSYLLLGRACLDVGDVTAALVAYASATDTASVDPEGGFRIRNACADDLFLRGRYGLAREALQRCHDEANTPVERAWAVTMQIVYADWYDGDEKLAATHLDQLDQIYNWEVTAPTLEWQKLVYDYMQPLRDVAREAIKGGTDARMLMDSFAAVASFRQMDTTAVVERMGPWAEKYTLDDIAALDESKRGMALDALASYYMALRSPENVDGIVAFFQSILNHPILGATPKNVVDANCCMGYCMSLANRLEEALAYYDAGLTADEQYAEIPQHPLEIHPPYVRGGIVRPEDREGYVANYRNVRTRLEFVGGQ